MFDTKQQRGAAIAVVAVSMALAGCALGWMAERLVQDEAQIAAHELEAVFGEFESFADTQLAMVTGDLGLPAGASLHFVGGVQAVALQEVRVLTGARCVRVEASAPNVDGALRVDETVVSRRSCGS